MGQTEAKRGRENQKSPALYSRSKATKTTTTTMTTTTATMTQATVTKTMTSTTELCKREHASTAGSLELKDGGSCPPSLKKRSTRKSRIFCPLNRSKLYFPLPPSFFPHPASFFFPPSYFSPFPFSFFPFFFLLFSSIFSPFSVLFLL